MGHEPSFLSLIFTVPIVAIVFGVGGEMMKTWVKSRERMMELKIKLAREQNQKSGGGDASVLASVEALRAEVASLRDTSTQFDMALEQNVQHIADRVGRIETRNSALSYTEEKPVQKIGRG